MDADFEQHYQAAERAYGLGDYAEAHALASAFWDQLQPDIKSPSDSVEPMGLIKGIKGVFARSAGR